MINKIKNIIIKKNLDGYIVPKNDKYFTEYSNISNLKLVSNFSGSAGFAIILKNKNYLFVDGRYTIQAKKQAGKKFKIFEIPLFWPKNIFASYKNKLNIGFDPKLFTYNSLNHYFENTCNLNPINEDLFYKIKNKDFKNNKFYKLANKITGESSKSKISRVVKILIKKKIDYLFISAGENVCWLMNIRGKDLPNSPIANCNLILTKNKENVFGLRVKGESMIDALVGDGDLVLLEPITKPNNGDMVAAWLEDREEATLKHFYLEGNKVRLVPANSMMQPITVSASNVAVKGRVVGVMRTM